MYTLAHGLIREGRKDSDWGTFIAPDRELETIADPNTKLNVYIPSGIKADFFPFRNRDSLFDSIVGKVVAQRNQMNYEEQCSAKYYFDCFSILNESRGQINRIAEVGPYLGGASCIFAGCIQPFQLELDLIEAKREFLYYTYERIRRAFPEAVSKVRLFYGDLPSYVKNILQHENQTKILVHHDAAHNFNLVMNDLASLSFVKEKLHGLMIQDTHLRSAKLENYVFVDAAVFATFGFNAKLAELGVKYTNSTQPAYAGKTYFIEHNPEGYYIPFAQNQFIYPHPLMKLEEIDIVV